MSEHTQALKQFGDAAVRYPLLTAQEEIELGRLVRTWQDHPAGPDDCPAPIRRRGLRARDRLAQGNLRLVMRHVARHGQALAPDAETADVLQSACLGLVRAVERFDPERGYKFSTYATFWLEKKVRDVAVKPGARPIHVPSGVVADLRTAAGDLGAVPAEQRARLEAGAVALSCRSFDAPVKCLDGQHSLLESLVDHREAAVAGLDRQAAIDALAELRAVADPDDLAMLELLAEGVHLYGVASAVGLSRARTARMVEAARESLSRLPAVAAVLAIE